MTRRRGLLYHFTHISNLASIAAEGLFSDAQIETSRRAPTEVGHADVKRRRRNLAVPLAPGGCVADYVPFYFAARSPMLYIISKGDVPTYGGGQDEIVYLVTSTETIAQERLRFVFTDRNAALGLARYGDDLQDLDGYLDWELMEGLMWYDTAEEPDRMERRMAEFLVHGHVPWSAFVGVAARDDEKCQEAEHEMSSVGIEIPVRPRPSWYF